MDFAFRSVTSATPAATSMSTTPMSEVVPTPLPNAACPESSRACLRRLGNGDVEAGLGRLGRAEERAGGDVHHQQEKTGPEQCAENLVEFEGVHFLELSPARKEFCGTACGQRRLG